MEHRLCLTAVTHLLLVVTSLPLRVVRRLPCLVLCDLVRSMLAALLAFAEGLPLLRDVHHGLRGGEDTG